MSRRSILTMAAAEFASELKDGVFQEIRRRLPGAGEDSGGGTAQEGGTEKDPEDRQQEKLAELGQETLTVEGGNQVVHSEEAAKEALEKELVQAIAALAGEENE